MRPISLMALLLAAGLSAACGEPPSIALSDGGDIQLSPDDGAVPVLPTVELPRERTPFGNARFAVDPPVTYWTSPPACAHASEPAYCERCWSWFDEGPASLGRNQSGGRFGSAVATADFNGDGYPDLAVGAPNEVRFGNPVGSVFVYLGSAEGFRPWRLLDMHEFPGGNQTGAGFGQALATGDFDGDGLFDLVVAAHSLYTPRVFVAYGAPAGFTRHAVFIEQDIDPDMRSTSGPLGESMVVGDFDGDANTDIALSAPQYPTDDLTDAGAVFVLHGSSTGLASPLRLTLWDASTQPYAGFRFGSALAAARMQASDSVDTLVVGVDGKGVVVQFEDVTAVDVAGSDTELPDFGRSLAVGDLDGDGAQDVIAGGTGREFVEWVGRGEKIHSPDWSARQVLATAAADLDADGDAELLLASLPLAGDDYSVYGYAWDGLALQQTFALSIPSREANDQLGLSSSSRDLDGDGYVDLVFGAPATDNATAHGRAYVFIPGPTEWSGSVAPKSLVDQELALTCEICEVNEWADGWICDATGDHICVSEVCVERGCGDGYREYGPTPPAEECDDGNEDDTDGCTTLCESTVIEISSRPEGADSTSGQAPALALAVDSGTLLSVFVTDTGGERRIRARRFSPEGTPLDPESSPLEISGDLGVGWDPQVSVTQLGLDAGFWIVWSDPTVDGDGAGIAMRRVTANGTVGALRVVNEDRRGAQREPRASLTGFDGAFAVVWTDESGLDAPIGQSVIEARRFDSTGAPIEGEWAVSPPDAMARQPAVATTLSRWIVAWTEEGDDTFDPRSWVYARRFGPTSSDTEPFLISDADASSVALSLMTFDDFGAAWVSREDDPRGDIRFRGFPAIGATGSPSSHTVISAVQGREERSPALTFVGNMEGYLVAWEDGGRRRGVRFASSITLPPRATELAAWMQDGLQGDVSVQLTFGGGVFFAWSDAGSLGDPDAYRSHLGFHLR